MALFSTFLLTLLGLTIDAVRLYVLSAQAERAAEAGALAGTIYLPNYFNTLSPDGQDAVTRACALLQANGITACPVPLGQVGATPALVPGYPDRLQVTVTLQADVFFLNLIAPNLNTAIVSRSASAEYLPPINQGITNGHFGDEEDDDDDEGPQPQQWFWAHINGPLEVKENGDAYTPLYEEGPTDPVASPDAIGSTPYQLNRFVAQPGTQTNHPQYTGGAIANPDTQKAGFTGAGGTLGYDFQIVIPPGTQLPINLEVYNLPFAAGNTTTGTHPINETLGSACFDSQFQVGGVCTTDNLAAYPHLVYSVYSAPLQFERSADVLLNGPNGYSPDSLDMLPADLSKHGCAASQVYDVTLSACAASPTSLDNWTILYTFTTSGIYRLSVEATSGYGLHNYGVQLTDAQRDLVRNGAYLWWWNTMCVSFDSTATTAIYSLGLIPTVYAGRTLSFNFFDLGVSPGTTYVELLDPNNTPVTFPAWVNTVPGSNSTQIDASNWRYNGEWVRIPVQIPANYSPHGGAGWWRIKFNSPAGNLSTVMTITITPAGSPIHLVL